MRLAPAQQRDIADLYLQDQTLWAVAVQESTEHGPFASVIYPVATLDVSKSTALQMIAAPLAHWTLDSEKVEALASAPPLLPNAAIAIGSENEFLNGTWRVLANPLQQPEAQKQIEPKAAEVNSLEANALEANTLKAKPSEAQPSEPMPSEPMPSEPMPSEQKPSEPKASAAKPIELN
jgi:hypothetical protein